MCLPFRSTWVFPCFLVGSCYSTFSFMCNVSLFVLFILAIVLSVPFRFTTVSSHSTVVNTSRSFPRSWLITGIVTRLTRRVSLVEQELLILPEHLGSPPVFSGVRVTRSIVLYCIVCPSSIYGFWLHLWYLPTLLFYFSFYYLDFKWLWYKSNINFYISNVYWILMFSIYLQPGYTMHFNNKTYLIKRFDDYLLYTC